MKVFLNIRMYLSDEDWIPTSSDEFNANIDALLGTLNSFTFLPDVEIFYSNTEFERFFSNIENITEISDYSITNPIQRIRQLLLEVESTNWMSIKKHRDDHRYYYLYNLGAQTAYVNDTTLAEACEHKHNSAAVCLVNLHSSEFNATPNIHVSRSNINPPYITNGYNLDCLVNTAQCITWYHNNRPVRTYTWNRKHGEQGKGVLSNKGEVVSPLLCGRDDAKLYLETAIGYRKTNELYCFDTKNKKFMVWKHDAPGAKSYHAYHPIDQGEIDDNVKDFILKTNN
jgi:hypothetical protein